jgi:hypothetical protein
MNRSSCTLITFDRHTRLLAAACLGPPLATCMSSLHTSTAAAAAAAAAHLLVHQTQSNGMSRALYPCTAMPTSTPAPSASQGAPLLPRPLRRHLWTTLTPACPPATLSWATTWWCGGTRRASGGPLTTGAPTGTRRCQVGPGRAARLHAQQGPSRAAEPAPLHPARHVPLPPAAPAAQTVHLAVHHRGQLLVTTAGSC